MALQNVEANITLDLYNHDTTPATVKAIQLDSETRYVAARLQNVGVQYDVDSGATVQLIVVRPDKVGVQITGTTFTYGDESSEYLGPYAELTQVALAVNGKMRGQFKITSGDQILRTEIFAISNGEALDASTDEWADEYDGHNLEEMATSIETNTADIASLEADVSQIKEDLSEYEGIFTGNVDESVKNWLDEHPEATTTVEDGSLTEAKLSSNLANLVKNPKGNLLTWCIQTQVGNAQSYKLAVSNDGKTFNPIDGYKTFLADAPSNVGTDWQHFEEDGVHVFTITYYNESYDVYVAFTSDFINWTHRALSIGFADASSLDTPYVWTPQIFKYNNAYYMAATVQEGIAASRATYYGDSLERYSGIYCTEITIDFENFTITQTGNIQRISFPSITDNSDTTISIDNYCMDAWFQPTADGLVCIVNDRYTLTIHSVITTDTTPFGTYSLLKSNIWGLRSVEAPTVLEVSDGAWKVCACLYNTQGVGEHKNLCCLTQDFTTFYNFDTFGSTDVEFISGTKYRMRNPSLFYMTAEQQSNVSNSYNIKCATVETGKNGGVFPIYDGSALYLNGFDYAIMPNTYFTLTQSGLTLSKFSLLDNYGIPSQIVMLNRTENNMAITYDGTYYVLLASKGAITFDSDGNVIGMENVHTTLSNSNVYASTGSASVSGSSAYIYGERMCTVSLNLGGISLASGVNAAVVQLATALRPAAENHICGFVGSGSVTGTPVRAVIYRDGNVSIYAPSAITSTVRLSATYIVRGDT